MRDVMSDWNRWSRSERVGAVTLVAALVAAFVICGCSIFGDLSKGSGVGLAPVHQAQAPYFVSDEERFLNSVMVRAYNRGDIESLEELLQYWQDTHSSAI